MTERVNVVRKNNLCFNCLLQGHTSYKCSSSRCRRCDGGHNTLLHYEQSKPSKSFQTEISSQEKSENQSCIKPPCVNLFGNKKEVNVQQILLATAWVKVETLNGQIENLRVLVDSGSQASFITENCVQHLRLKRKSISVPVNGLGASNAGHSSALVSVNLKSSVDSTFNLVLDALVLKKLTGQLPNFELSVDCLPNFCGISLADPQFFKPGNIDIWLGADVYGRILLNGIIEGCPTAQNTRFGWILFGPIKVTHANSQPLI